jgi:hypothetical protein
MADQLSPTNAPSEPSSDAPSEPVATPQDGPVSAAAPEQIVAEPEAITSILPPPALEDALLVLEGPNRSTTSRPFTTRPWQRLTRRQVLTGVGIGVGVAAIGVGTTLALLTSTPAPGATPSASSSLPGSPPIGSSPPQGTPTSLDQTLQAWRTKHLTAAKAQRFKHHTGTALVPLGVVETNYPNKYNPYHAHLQGYVLGGALVANTQFFLYLGLESIDGSQFVGKVRVGPIDQSAAHFGILVTQQSTDDIEGGSADYSLVTLAPKAFYQVLSTLVDHCIVVDLIRQPLPPEAEGVPQNMLLEINQQAMMSDQFLQVDFEAIHHTPLSRISTSKLIPIRHLIDASPITYTASTDAGRYPLVIQVVLRHTDRLLPKLIGGINTGQELITI